MCVYAYVCVCVRMYVRKCIQAETAQTSRTIFLSTDSKYSNLKNLQRNMQRNDSIKETLLNRQTSRYNRDKCQILIRNAILFLNRSINIIMYVVTTDTQPVPERPYTESMGQIHLFKKYSNLIRQCTKKKKKNS